MSLFDPLGNRFREGWGEFKEFANKKLGKSSRKKDDHIATAAKAPLKETLGNKKEKIKAKLEQLKDSTSTRLTNVATKIGLEKRSSPQQSKPSTPLANLSRSLDTRTPVSRRLDELLPRTGPTPNIAIIRDISPDKFANLPKTGQQLLQTLNEQYDKFSHQLSKQQNEEIKKEINNINFNKFAPEEIEKTFPNESEKVRNAFVSECYKLIGIENKIIQFSKGVGQNFFTDLNDPTQKSSPSTPQSLEKERNAARQEMQETLVSLGKKEIIDSKTKKTVLKTISPEPSSKKVPAWKLTKSIESLQDSELVTIGSNFKMSGAELKKLQDSTKITYRSKKHFNKDVIWHILNFGFTEPMQGLAKNFCVASDAVLVRDAAGNLIKREPNDPLPLFKVYSTTAPGIRSQPEKKQFIKDKFNLRVDLYQKELKESLDFFFKNCKEDGVQIPILPSFGLDGFGNTSERNIASQCFADALKESIQEWGEHFEGFVILDNEPEISPISHMLKQDKENDLLKKIIVTDRSPLEIVQKGTQKGLKIGLLNLGNGNGQAGEAWETTTSFEPQELLGISSTLILTQHPGANPRLLKTDNYQLLK